MPKGPKPKSVAERFWPKVLKLGKNKCWKWLAGKNAKGYGRLSDGKKMDLAHRLSWILHNGPLPYHNSYHGMCVLHRCDNPECTNPKHLFLGTNDDNIRDMHAKHRQNGGSTKGEAHKCSKLRNRDIPVIRAWLGSQQSAADYFGVSQPIISAIKLGKIWRHIP